MTNTRKPRSQVRIAKVDESLDFVTGVGTVLTPRHFVILDVATGEQITAETFASRDAAETFLSGPDRMSKKAEAR